MRGVECSCCQFGDLGGWTLLGGPCWVLLVGWVILVVCYLLCVTCWVLLVVFFEWRETDRERKAKRAFKGSKAGFPVSSD